MRRAMAIASQRANSKRANRSHGSTPWLALRGVVLSGSVLSGPLTPAAHRRLHNLWSQSANRPSRLGQAKHGRGRRGRRLLELPKWPAGPVRKHVD
jgi:hypothetical protein